MRSSVRHDKVRDIKTVRALTQILGKLGIKYCYSKWEEVEYLYDSSVYNGPRKCIGQRTIHKISYGWGLKVTKDYVEYKYEYRRAQEST